MRPAAGGDKRFYAPNRDIAHVFPTLINAALNTMGQEDLSKEPWLNDYLVYTGTTEQDLADAAIALANSIGNFTKDEIKTPFDALTQAGWFETKPGAQIAILARISQISIGAFFIGLRDITLENEEAPASVKEMVKTGEQLRNDIYSRTNGAK